MSLMLKVCLFLFEHALLSAHLWGLILATHTTLCLAPCHMTSCICTNSRKVHQLLRRFASTTVGWQIAEVAFFLLPSCRSSDAVFFGILSLYTKRHVWFLLLSGDYTTKKWRGKGVSTLWDSCQVRGRKLWICSLFLRLCTICEQKCNVSLELQMRACSPPFRRTPVSTTRLRYMINCPVSRPPGLGTKVKAPGRDATLVQSRGTTLAMDPYPDPSKTRNLRCPSGTWPCVFRPSETPGGWGCKTPR